MLAPVLTEAAPHAGAPAYKAGVPLPRGVSLTPAVADLDGDGALEVVVTNSGGTVSVYDRTGRLLRTSSVDRALSAPALLTKATTSRPASSARRASVTSMRAAQGWRSWRAGSTAASTSGAPTGSASPASRTR